MPPYSINRVGICMVKPTEKLFIYYYSVLNFRWSGTIGETCRLMYSEGQQDQARDQPACILQHMYHKPYLKNEVASLRVKTEI